LARPIASAEKAYIDSACSVGSMIFISCRRSSGYSAIALPKARRPRAGGQRLVEAAAHHRPRRARRG
jgi:hypothetical protein